MTIDIDMEAIPGGSFLMGSPENEFLRFEGEGPQHEVTVHPFLVGRYPITQAQWRAVAGLPRVKQILNPDPSSFKGDNRPVEQVSWREAVEFCDRLSRLTGREYRLPSEAEWEYACRSGSTSPFHFGETITTDLANYDGRETYGVNPIGVYREETTEVGSFPPNSFGLYDMHGNVWEWCLDHFHDSYGYEGAPADGSVWVTEWDWDNDLRVLRGGAWYGYSNVCRSAYRSGSDPDFCDNTIGFRVVSMPPAAA